MRGQAGKRECGGWVKSGSYTCFFARDTFFQKDDSELNVDKKEHLTVAASLAMGTGPDPL